MGSDFDCVSVEVTKKDVHHDLHKRKHSKVDACFTYGRHRRRGATRAGGTLR